MFGYVRPLRGELKVKHFEQFKAAYCGLCHTLENRYGPFARWILNYDFTFLAILLSPETQPDYLHLRCAASPLRKKCVCARTGALELAADDSMILFWWKLKDSVSDSPFPKAAVYRLLSLFFYPAYRKAARLRPEFDRQVSLCLRELKALEEDGCDSLDRPADTFARILSFSALGVEDPKRRRPLEQLLYHLGRWIYIVDACDDLAADLKEGNYNPVALRYALSASPIAGEALSSLETTLRHSQSLMASAFELVDFGVWSDILENMIYLGLPQVTRQVLDGSFRSPAKKWDRRTENE
ncbi:DUF5685 family protein [Papillibacter cinnamivorans]|uniref:Uncharacterized protein n=1 Tax=Papillibacter cinnamivorans DSM 12816 TaxID=1122930 RepID=A0A1W1YVF3_9FIRM|nr:DUF5685 family protein [Papillibacter cinnamivorans]SMC40190.1 hypothetical protein SAMN02745168_0702 [Papillibacter cinnamivorans DSM 12816]